MNPRGHVPDVETCICRVLLLVHVGSEPLPVSVDAGTRPLGQRPLVDMVICRDLEFTHRFADERGERTIRLSPLRQVFLEVGVTSVFDLVMHTVTLRGAPWTVEFSKRLKPHQAVSMRATNQHRPRVDKES